MIARGRDLLRAYFAAIVLMAFGSLCFGAGLILESLIAGNVCSAAIYTVAMMRVAS
jgi:hypothetical protein